MLDNQLIRNQLEMIKAGLARRGFEVPSEHINALEVERKSLQQSTEQLQAERNSGAKTIGKAKAQGQDIEPIKAQMNAVNEQLEQQQSKLKQVQQELHDALAVLPNLLCDSVPNGTSEDDNVEISRWGQLPEFEFEPKDHVSVGEGLQGLSAGLGAKIVGARFTLLQGDVAKLHRVLGQFMLDMQRAAGYIEVNVPSIVNGQSLYGTGNLPKFGEDLFKLEADAQLYLAPTAEVALTNIVAGAIVLAERLPLKFVAIAPCFRSEAGSYGRDTRGFIRQHQFEKVELVQVTTAEQAEAAHEAMTGHAEAVLQTLELPYRKMLLCAGDTGFHSRKTYDLEVWLPGQSAYREISSCSQCGDFQARRMGARYRATSEKQTQLVHTLNGSALAIGRTLVAVLENYQLSDGRVRVPKALIAMMGTEYLEPAPAWNSFA